MPKSSKSGTLIEDYAACSDSVTAILFADAAKKLISLESPNIHVWSKPTTFLIAHAAEAMF
jgi:hypothetical protein